MVLSRNKHVHRHVERQHERPLAGLSSERAGMIRIWSVSLCSSAGACVASCRLHALWLFDDAQRFQSPFTGWRYLTRRSLEWQHPVPAVQPLNKSFVDATILFPEPTHIKSYPVKDKASTQCLYLPMNRRFSFK